MKPMLTYRLPVSRRLFVFGFATLVLGSSFAQAQPASDLSTAAMTDGEVRMIDKPASTLTLRHGAIANLQMPPMTMVFRVTDAAMLDSVDVGDKVRFRVERVQGAITVMRIERVK